MIKTAANVDATKEMLHRFDDYEASDERQIGIALQEWLCRLFDLGDRRHRLGLTSVALKI